MLQFILSTWRAGFRGRLFFGAFALGVALVGVAYLAASFSPRQPQTVAVDVGISGLKISLALFATLLVQELVGKEIERRAVVLTLSYPVSRSAYLFGRYFGVLGLMGGATALLALLLWVSVFAVVGGGYDQQFALSLGVPYWAAVLGVWLDVAVIAAFVLWVSALSTVSSLPLVLGMVFTVSARALGAVYDYVSKGADGQDGVVKHYGPALDIAHWLLPDLSRLDWRTWPMYGVAPDPATSLLAVVSSLAYIGLMLGLAAQVFSRREFS